jgi:SulP family sulfate permease
MALTIVLSLTLGVIVGLLAGVAVSVMMHLYRTSRPHLAIVGQVPGTQHFRNVNRHQVVTSPPIVSLRIDESLYFPNVRYLEAQVNALVAANPDAKHLILNCSAVNAIDASGLESLIAINQRLKEGGIAFHLAEVKGPITDVLKKTPFYRQIANNIHLTHYEAVCSIDPEQARHVMAQTRA